VKYALLLTALFCFHTSHFAFGVDPQPPLHQTDYESIRDASHHITQTFPPDGNYYLGIGRGPAGIMAFLSLTQPGGGSTVPFSAPSSSFSIDRFDPALHAADLKPIFDKFLPKPNDLGTRRIVAIDDTLSGGTLLFFIEAVKHYYSSRGEVPPKIGVVALSVSRMPLELEQPIRRTGAELLWIDTNKFPGLATRLTFGTDKSSAEFENVAEAASAGRELKPRPEYLALQRQMGQFILEDKTLSPSVTDRCRIQLSNLGKH
jgi:hypothetical protein